MKWILHGMLCACACIPGLLFAGKSDDTASISHKLSDKYVHSIGKRSEEVSNKIDENTEKYLNALKAKELILQQQLSKIDQSAAARIFANSQQQYDNLKNQLKNNAQNVLNSYGRYVPGIDSAITSLKFLEQGNLANSKLGSQVTQIKSAMSKVKELENQFKKADNVEDFIRQRKAYLEEQLKSYNLGNYLQQYNKDAYYYSQQVTELKEAWQDPDKMEKKAIEYLNKYKPFQDFMKKNSMIAGLFNIPDDYGTAGLAGLQTQSVVNKAMQDQMANMGPNAAANVQQSVLDAQSSLTSLRNKLNQSGSPDGLPNFKPNDQKTKSFLKRLEYGVNFNNTRSNGIFPVSTSFAGTVAYKLNTNSSIGVGIAYILGWGENIQHIHLSNQGIGFRSFFNTKIKGSFYATGGFEYNYMNPFASLDQVIRNNLWQRSGLIGISKNISLRGNFVKKTSVSLLWDFLSYQQIPRTQPFIFRFGYTF